MDAATDGEYGESRDVDGDAQHGVGAAPRVEVQVGRVDRYPHHDRWALDACQPTDHPGEPKPPERRELHAPREKARHWHWWWQLRF
eukprot:scaffold76056_cov70-Phaeocystis_antarctica.AAC.14